MKRYRNILISFNLIIIGTAAILLGVHLYYQFNLHECHQKCSSGCPRPTCAIDDDKCGAQPFYITQDNNKVCVDRTHYYDSNS